MLGIHADVFGIKLITEWKCRTSPAASGKQQKTLVFCLLCTFCYFYKDLGHLRTKN